MIFSGFPEETQKFLRELRDNNRKQWFDAHRDDYEQWYLDPASRFVVAAGELLRKWRPEIHAEPRVLGSIFRVNRDPRSRGSAGPYKDHIDFWFWEGERKKAASGYFLRLAPEFVGIGAGRHGFDREQLARFRSAIDTPAFLDELAQIIDTIERRGYMVAGARRRGAPPSDPHARLRPHRGLFVHHDEPAGIARDGGALMSACEKVWADLTPLHTWLVSHAQVPAEP